MSPVAHRCADAILRIGAEAVLIQDGERRPFTASIQPRKSDEGPATGPLGIGAAALYTLYALTDGAGALLAPGDTVECMERRYYVLRAETFTLKGEPLYRWAVLRLASGTAAS